MGYPDDPQKIKSRYHSYEEQGYPGLKDNTLGMLDRDLRYFMKDAEIPAGPDNRVPESGGVPRIFVIGVDENGAEKPMRLEEAGLDLFKRDEKFWKQVALGNVFAYPAGADHPVQLQIDPEKYDGGFSFSEPVPPEKIPSRNIKQPGFLARLLNRISGGRWHKEVTAYNRQQQSGHKLELEHKLSDMNAARVFDKSSEKAIYQESVAETERRKAQEKLETKLDSAKNKLNAFDKGYEILHSVYKPLPEKKDYLTKVPEKNKAGLYTDEHFADLKVFSKDELDLSKIVLAPKGKIGPSVSEKDFCAVAMFAGMHYEIGEKSRLIDPNAPARDIHAADCLQRNLGLTEAEARQIMVEDITGMYTTDMFILPSSRDSSGKYFRNGVNMARQSACDAFNAYKNGNKEPLAKLLAFGVDRTCNQLVSLGGAPGDAMKGPMRMGLHLITLMDKDPELKQLAFDNGMTDTQLKTVKNLKDYFDLDEARKKAEVKLAEAAARGKELSAEEKESCMKSILKARLVDNIWLNEAKAENEKTREIQDKMMNPENVVMVSPEQNKRWKLHPEERPAPPEGKFWSDTGQNSVMYVQRLYRPTPPVLGSLKDQTSLNEIVDRMIKEDKVAEKSCEQLADLHADVQSGLKLPAWSIRIAEQIQKEKLLALNPEQNIKNADEGKKPQAEEPDIDLDEPLNINEEIEKRNGPQAHM